MKHLTTFMADLTYWQENQAQYDFIFPLPSGLRLVSLVRGNSKGNGCLVCQKTKPWLDRGS